MHDPCRAVTWTVANVRGSTLVHQRDMTIPLGIEIEDSGVHAGR